jgi:lipoate-protein ligase A
MALDEALAADPPVLRLYDWDPPGLSLGWFQRGELAGPLRDALAREPRAVVVRRVTGGGAIWHQHDLTFALIAPPDCAPFAGPIEASYAAIHRAVAAGLARLGAAAAPRGDDSAGSDSGRRGEAVCFHAATRFDLVAAGRKLVGSAQRRRRDRILHHGSIPIRRNALATDAMSLEQLLGRTPAWAEVADAVALGFASELGLRFTPSEPTAGEWRMARELATTRFGGEGMPER